MSNNFFQHLFDRKPRELSPRARRLSLESLENREMLNVDWGGFGSETKSTYASPETSSCSVDLPSKVDACVLINLEGDSKSELVSIDGDGKTISVYKCSSDGKYVLKTEQTVGDLGAWEMNSYATFADFDDDGFSEMLLLTSTGFEISASVYSWDEVSSKFIQRSTCQLDSTPFIGSYSTYVFTELRGALLSNATGGYDLALQVGVLPKNGSFTTTTAVYSGVASSSFGNGPIIKSAISGEILGSTNIGGASYLLLKDVSSSTNTLILSKIGAQTVTQTRYDFTGFGSKFVFECVAEKDGFIVVGSNLGNSSKYGLVTLNLTSAPEDGATVDASAVGQWIDCDKIKINPSSVMTLGDAVGDSDLELLVVNDEEKASIFYMGDASTAYGYTFTESTLVVSTPEYHSVYVGDYDGDGAREAVLVGDNCIYVGDVDESGALSNLLEKYKFSQPVEKAVFGDFDADGLLDVAVQFKANVGSSFQICRQIYDGSFVPVATRTVSGSFVDLTVGRFARNDRDEVAVLSVSYKSSSTWSYVNVYSYDSSTNSVSNARSSSYEGLGTSIASGELYGSGRSDIVVTNLEDDAVAVFRNTGSSLNRTNITTRYTGSNPCRPTSAAIGDFDGDGLADLAVMNSSSGSNAAEVVYYRRTETGGLGSKPFGRVQINNNAISSVDNTAIVGKLLASDLNGDGFADLTFVRKATDGTAYVSSLLGNGASSFFDSVVNAAVTCDPANLRGVALARVDSGNSSDDFVWAQGKNFAVLLNGAENVPSAYVKYVLQNASVGSGDSLQTAVSTQPTWLDEWSTFYVDVWASSDAGSVASVVGSFNFDSSLFSFAEAVGATGFSVSANSGAGFVSFAVNGAGTADDQGWVVVARLKFTPVENGGLALNEAGNIYFATPGFSAGASSQKVNGSTVARSDVPVGVEVYPFIFDLNDNGEVDLNDFAQFIGNYPAKPTSNISVAKYRVLDVNGNNEYDLNDYAYALASYPMKWTHSGDYSYQVKPVVASTSSAAIMGLSILDEEDDMFVDDLALDAIAETFAVVESRGVEQRVASTGQATAERPVFCGPLTRTDAAKFDLNAELETEL